MTPARTRGTRRGVLDNDILGVACDSRRAAREAIETVGTLENKRSRLRSGRDKQQPALLFRLSRRNYACTENISTLFDSTEVVCNLKGGKNSNFETQESAAAMAGSLAVHGMFVRRCQPCVLNA